MELVCKATNWKNMKTEFRHTLYCVNHTQTICDHSFIQTLTVTSSLKCSNFQWKFVFFFGSAYVSGLVQLHSIRNENDGWAHFYQHRFFVLFVRTPADHHLHLSDAIMQYVWITQFCGCVTSCGFFTCLSASSQCIIHHIHNFRAHRANNGLHFVFVRLFIRHAFYGVFYMT